jgi:hypothetical protein
MLLIQCQGCNSTAFADCGCPPGHDPMAAGEHHPECAMADLGAQLVCPPGSGCCDGSAHPDASHDQAASACTAEHDGDCHVDNPACAVCRPVTITVMPGSTVIQGVS